MATINNVAHPTRLPCFIPNYLKNSIALVIFSIYTEFFFATASCNNPDNIASLVVVGITQGFKIPLDFG